MESSADISSLLKKGGLVQNVEGSSLKEIYTYISQRIKLPEEITAETFVNELLMRENVLSTAVGNSIAIPHPRRALLKNPADERIIVCYLKNSIDMNAPDSLSVTTFFIVLSSSARSHLSVLSSLAKLFRNRDFTKFLSMKPDLEKLSRKAEELMFL